MKKLIPALCMLLISATLLGTSTFAWFSMNTRVSATGMKVQAKAEGGIVISNELKSTWSDSATASHSTLTNLIPTSTKDTSTWYHATTTSVTNGSSSDYASFSETNKDLAIDGNGVGVWRGFTEVTGITTENFASKKANGTITHKQASDSTVYDELGSTDSYVDGTKYFKLSSTSNVFLLNKFYVRSSTATAESKTLYIDSVKAETTTAGSIALNRALRVAVVTGTSTVSVFAPFDVATSEKIGGSSTATLTVIGSGDLGTTTGIGSIPANTDVNGAEIKIYVYFDGEDPNCKSENLTSALDSLTISVHFSLSSLADEKVKYTHTLTQATSSKTTNSDILKNGAFVATYTASGTYVLPKTVTVKIGTSTTGLTAGTDYTWNAKTGELYVLPSKVTDSVNVTVNCTDQKVDFDTTLTNVTLASVVADGESQSISDGDSKVITNRDMVATFAAATDKVLPATITVKINNVAAVSGTDYTWDKNTGTLTISGAKLTGKVEVSITAGTV